MDKQHFNSIIENSTSIILDTNIIFGLAKYSFNTCNNILSLLDNCFDIIWIPNQVYLEINNNKIHQFNKAKKKYNTFKNEIKSIINDTRSKLTNKVREAQKNYYPSCDNLSKNIQSKIDELKQVLEEYYNNLGNENNKTIKDDQINSIESFIEKIVSNGKVGEGIPYLELINIYREGDFRYKYNIPPGYEDVKNKKGLAIFGDLIIWKEIINYTKTNERSSIIFITNDLKEDWWVLKGEEKTPVCIRPELKSEFKDINKNTDIYLLSLSQFQLLASNYYNMISLYTEMELNAENYCRNVLYKKYRDELYDEVLQHIVDIDNGYFSSDFERCNIIEHEIYELEVKQCDIVINDDLAVYTFTLSTNTIINYTFEDSEGDVFHFGYVDFDLEANVEFHVDIELDTNNLLNDNGFEITNFSYNDIKVNDVFDYYSDREAEMNEALEEHYKH